MRIPENKGWAGWRHRDRMAAGRLYFGLPCMSYLMLLQFTDRKRQTP